VNHGWGVAFSLVQPDPCSGKLMLQGLEARSPVEKPGSVEVSTARTARPQAAMPQGIPPTAAAGGWLGGAGLPAAVLRAIAHPRAYRMPVPAISTTRPWGVWSPSEPASASGSGLAAMYAMRTTLSAKPRGGASASSSHCRGPASANSSRTISAASVRISIPLRPLQPSITWNECSALRRITPL
jgi:hypothetical protein